MFILYPYPLWDVQVWSLVKVSMVQTHSSLLSASLVSDISGALSVRFVLYSIFVQLYLQKYSIFVLFVDKIKYSNCPISQYEYDP